MVHSGLAPDFVLPAAKGPDVRLSGLRGRAVLLSFWARWCPSCVKKLPILGRLQDEFKEGLSILAINVEEEKELVKRFVEGKGVALRVLLDGGMVGSKYGVSRLPHLVLVDKKGEIAFAQSGSVSFELLRDEVKRVVVP
ncbi:MAG: TlpA disulfide reductase family protein [Pseudomonadota bacterium]